ncbi:MAG: hypothetical protein WC934_12130 [Acidithiobacillus sp.]|jgi:hypothetical protein|uniref:hypothetical protein n=1 Tax=Acidithiobacillus sp. TaxID=1872118 RepID=UPI00355CEAB1
MRFFSKFFSKRRFIDTPINDFFGLSRANYYVCPRSVLQAMPNKWQKKFIKLVEEMENKIDCEKCIGDYSVLKRDFKGKFESDPFANYRISPQIPFKNK